MKRWRHLDLGASRWVIECELRRLRCLAAATSSRQAVPQARAESSDTLDFEGIAAFLAQQMAPATASRRRAAVSRARGR
ncbi:MAG: hypothetical protein WBP81_02985 [Solirubrobacteraceae bacterium]